MIPEKLPTVQLSYVLRDTHPTVTSMRNPLLKKGAAALIISDDLSFDVPKNVAVIKVENTRKALAYISAEFLADPPKN